MTTVTLGKPLSKTYYPDSDGKPLAESDFQRKPLSYAVEALTYFFRDQPDVYVSGNLLIYYEEGNPDMSVAPDVFVALGVAKQERRSYFVWKEGKAPDFVIEVTSRSTRAEDQGAKRGTYAYLGVREYFQYDPTGDYLQPALRGDRLSGDHFVPLSPTNLPDGGLSFHSEVLKIELRLEHGQLGLYDPKTGKKLLTYEEAQDALQAEQGARRAAEAARLREELARLKGSG
jgi:Uma2 family endonuclease